jgi:YVTN family beta-propeller protein
MDVRLGSRASSRRWPSGLRATAACTLLAVLGLAAGQASATAQPVPGRPALGTPPLWLRGRFAALDARQRAGALVGSAAARHGHGLPPTVPVGDGPQTAALDQATHTIYVANGGQNGSGNTVSVVNARTCNSRHLAGCRHSSPTVTVGGAPSSVAVDQRTDTIYVPNFNDGTVSVINGATCNASNTSGCGQTPPVVTVGGLPLIAAVDQATDTVYVTNVGGNTVSVIDGATCNATNTSGCGQVPQTVTVGSTGRGIAVDQPTDTVYAATSGPGGNGPDQLWVINGATCNATVTTGCGQTPPTVTVGAGNTNLAIPIVVDQATGTVYVANANANTVSMIDKPRCNAHVTSGCSQPPPTVNVGSAPDGLALDRATHTVYVVNSNDNTISTIKDSTCNATDSSGCGRPAGQLRVGHDPGWVVVAPATDTVYVVNFGDATMSVVNGATCNATRHSGCTRFPPTVPVGTFPDGVAVNNKTHTVYVANFADGTVSVINGATCNAEVTVGCGQTPATVTVGGGPAYLAVNRATDTIYVPNFNDNTVSVINGATCNATVTTGCGQTPPTVTLSASPGEVVVDQATHTVYTGNSDGTVSVINGATCNATVTTGCGQIPPTVKASSSIADLAIDQATNTVYTTNFPDGTVSDINGATCNATVTTGCGQSPPTVTVGSGPSGVEVDQRTNTVYVTNFGFNATTGNGFGTTVSMINGATCDSRVTSGCDQIPPTLTAGLGPFDVAIDQTSDTVYVLNAIGYSVTVINGATCNARHPSGCKHSFPTRQVGGFPNAVDVSSATHTAYVANGNDNNVSVFGPPRDDTRR